MTKPIKVGSTDVSIVVKFVDSGDGTPETGVVAATAGLAINYWREGASTNTSISLSNLATLNTAHTDGGILHIGNGTYRLDLPDAAVASGADFVLVNGTATGMVMIPVEIPLVAYDPDDTVRLGLTALPNSAATTLSGLASRSQIQTYFESLLDYPVVETTIDTRNDDDDFILATGSDLDNRYNGFICVVESASDPDAFDAKIVSDYVGSTKQVLLNSSVLFTAAASDIVKIYYPTAANVSRWLDTQPLALSSQRVQSVDTNSATISAINANVATILTGKPAQKYNGLRGPGIYYNDDAANTNTVLGTDGTVDNPVSTWAAATTLAASLGANRIYMKGDSILTLTGATVTGYEIVGLNGPNATTVNLGTAASPSVLTRVGIFGATVYGTHDLSSRLKLEHCVLTDAPAAEITTLHVSANECTLAGDITVDTSLDNEFNSCTDGIAGGSAPTINATGAAGTIIINNYAGGLILDNLSASHNVSLNGNGYVTWGSGCNVNATIELCGNWQETDSTAGMSNITRDPVFNRTALTSALTSYDAATGTDISTQTTSLGILLAALPTAAENAAELLATETETGLTFQHAIQGIFSATSAKAAKSGTTYTLRDYADSKNRITATVDSNGQRTAITYSFD